MNLKSKTVSGIKWTTISTIIVSVCAILKISILSRYLSKSDFGLIAIVLLVMGFMNLFMELGLTSAILFKQKISKKEYASLFWLNFLSSGLLFVLVIIITPSIVNFYNEPQLNVLIPMMAISLIFSAFGRQFKTMKQKELKFKTISVIEIVSVIVSLIIAVYMAILNYGVYALVYASLAQHFISNMLFFIIGILQYGVKLHFRFNETKPFLKIGVFQVGSQVVNYFNRDLDILLIGKLFGSEALGGYSLAKQLVFRPAQIINPILTRVASPILAKFQNNLVLLRKHYLNLVNTVFSINLPIYILVIIFAPLIVTIFYGNGYQDIVIFVRILSVYMLLRSIGNPIGSLVIATGRTHLEFYWNLITLIIMPIVIIIAAQFSLVWVAISLTLIVVLLFVPNWWFLVNPLIKVKFKDFLFCLWPNYRFLKNKF